MSTTAELLVHTEQFVQPDQENESPLLKLLSKIPPNVQWHVEPSDFLSTAEIYGTFPGDEQKTDQRLGVHYFTLNQSNNSIQRVDVYECDFNTVPARLHEHIPDKAKQEMFQLEIKSNMRIADSGTFYDQTVTWTVPVRSDVYMYAAKLEVFVDANGMKHTINLFVPSTNEFAPRIDFNHDWEYRYSSNFSGNDQGLGSDILGYWVGKRNFDELVSIQKDRIEETIMSPATMLHSAIPGNPGPEQSYREQMSIYTSL